MPGSTLAAVVKFNDTRWVHRLLSTPQIRRGRISSFCDIVRVSIPQRYHAGGSRLCQRALPAVERQAWPSLPTTCRQVLGTRQEEGRTQAFLQQPPMARLRRTKEARKQSGTHRESRGRCPRLGSGPAPPFQVCGQKGCRVQRRIRGFRFAERRNAECYVESGAPDESLTSSMVTRNGNTDLRVARRSNATLS